MTKTWGIVAITFIIHRYNSLIIVVDAVDYLWEGFLYVCYFCKKTLKYPEFSWYLITKFVK